ncbi:hypothetical protein RclHR1_37590001 [Rhizophagus clarus]|uniref:BAH domain-containing protein n=1 Tax=Rhizophagus clarus TaxID=94130 RepID=A0A2Z6RCB8_9GLOM|nr:hypothetical protein RclHR1_37590001 [Rhizophagus clarus]
MDTIRHVLNNPSLLGNMYFRPGQEVTKSKEFWYGNVWKESARFGQASITIAQNVYYSGDFVIYRESREVKRPGRILAIIQQDGRLKIKIQRILIFKDLPKNLQSNDRRQRSQEGELWFLDQEMDNAIMNIKLQAIVNQITASILYDNVITNLNLYKIREILYKHRGHWKMRHVKYSYQHPLEFAALEELRISLLIYKLFIDLYYDDFGTFCNVYHLLGGIYIQIGNMPLTERHRLKNHFMLGFVPFGSSFDEFIKLFITEMKILEKEKIMSVQGNECVVIASLGVTTANLPQGNDMVRVKHHGANKGCQTCNMTKASLTSNNFDLQLVSHYHHQSDKQFEQIYVVQTITECKAITAEYGLQLNSPILDQLKRERHLQSSQDIYHLTARKMLRFLKITIEALSPEEKTKFIAVWKSFKYPKNSELELFQRRTGVTQSDHAVKLWLKCWVVMAKTMAIVFKDSFTEEEYDELHECLHNE